MATLLRGYHCEGYAVTMALPKGHSVVTAGLAAIRARVSRRASRCSTTPAHGSLSLLQ